MRDAEDANPILPLFECLFMIQNSMSLRLLGTERTPEACSNSKIIPPSMPDCVLVLQDHLNWDGNGTIVFHSSVCRLRSQNPYQYANLV